MSAPIKFWGVRGEQYGAFSNFSPHGFELDGRFWKTSEHYYQAQKFAKSTQTIPVNNKEIPVFDHIWNQKGPMGAAKEGRRRDFKLREDWDKPIHTKPDFGMELKVKDLVMYTAISAKFSAHKDIQNLLLSTGDLEIIEDSPTDYYWGCGKDGTGLNMLGKLLMELRSEFRLNVS